MASRGAYCFPVNEWFVLGIEMSNCMTFGQNRAQELSDHFRIDQAQMG